MALRKVAGEGGDNPRLALHFESINWQRVADSLEQSTLEYATLSKSREGGLAFASAALVIDAIKRAIREGLE